MRESADRNQFRPISSEHLITSYDKKSKTTLHEKELVPPDASCSNYMPKETIKKCEENALSPKSSKIEEPIDNSRQKRSGLNLNESEASEDNVSSNGREGKSREEFVTESKVSI